MELMKLIESIYNIFIILRAISRAHNIRKWCLIPGDFSVENGELTPTLKLKRRIVEKKWT